MNKSAIAFLYTYLERNAGFPVITSSEAGLEMTYEMPKDN